MQTVQFATNKLATQRLAFQHFSILLDAFDKNRKQKNNVLKIGMITYMLITPLDHLIQGSLGTPCKRWVGFVQICSLSHGHSGTKPRVFKIAFAGEGESPVKGIGNCFFFFFSKNKFMLKYNQLQQLKKTNIYKKVYKQII